ncbi:hypothetical protein BU24DRAFT_435427 [Aaosphaeria arxii CBS 175.79]|uniref:N-acetyltransferase domain-containing protein n=1 Tax=Aaosphaeria arxii CBS 175.79 TaxID=1450172 RepID=A0A6A5XFP6_9PLEO|nr:uncharacterized protein BU24DRAFT_435427 [Aaosphaeria arxii CBS 175.79]KAF2011968.1 hypothetical protein BU24DRAFT_435427 [Aaosphaeria arxii CBS 175.79]
MPNFEVQRCNEADMPRFFEILSLAFANDHEYVDSAGSERTLQLFHGDLYVNFLKVIDKDTGKMIAAAKWNLYEGGGVPPQPKLDGNYWENKEEKEFTQYMFHAFFASRQVEIEESGACLAALDMLMVDPAWQKQGAGRMLINVMGLIFQAVVEGSDRGRRLYATEGFDSPHYVCPVPEKFTTRRKQTYWWMKRPIQSKNSLNSMSDWIEPRCCNQR